VRVFWWFEDSDNGTITASNTGSGYRASNLQLDTLGSRWASDSVSATAVLALDFGSPISCTSFAFLGHNLIPGSDTVTLTYASDAGFTTGTGSITVTLTAENWYEYFSAVSRQYWRVTITKSLSTNKVYAGRMVLGTAYIPAYGVARRFQLGPGTTTSSSVTTRGGQKYTSLGTVRRVLRGMFRALPNADRAEFEELQKTNDIGKSFIVSIAWETEPVAKSIYGTLDRIVPPQDSGLNKWDWPIRMTEQK
jgi:hypothetical protein